MTKPSNRNTIMNSLIRGIPRYMFDGKTITPKKTMEDILEAQSKSNVLRPAKTGKASAK
jgi:hypothetical protein